MESWLGIIAGVGSGLLSAGIAYGVLVTRVGRLEKDVEQRATREAFRALEKRVDDNHNGIEKKLDKIEATLEALRADLARRRDDTDPGRR